MNISTKVANLFRKNAQGKVCEVCGKPLPSVPGFVRYLLDKDKKTLSWFALMKKDMLCYEHFLETDEGKKLLEELPPLHKVKLTDITGGGYAGGRLINQIHWHHTGSDSGNAASIIAYHMSLGWGEGAYQACICNGNGGPDGEIQFIKPDSHTPFSVGNYLNEEALAFVFVGDLTQHPMTDKQWESGVKHGKVKKFLYEIPKENFLPHRWARANSVCPGLSDSECYRFNDAVYEEIQAEPIIEEEDDEIMFKQQGRKFVGYQGKGRTAPVLYIPSSEDVDKAWPKGTSVAVQIWKQVNGKMERAGGAFRLYPGQKADVIVPDYEGIVEIEVDPIGIVKLI